MAKPLNNRFSNTHILVDPCASLVEEERAQLASMEINNEITFDDYVDITSKVAIYASQYQNVRTLNEFKDGLTHLVESELDEVRRVRSSPGNV